MQAVLTIKTTYAALAKGDLFLDPLGQVWLVKSPLVDGKLKAAPYEDGEAGKTKTAAVPPQGNIKLIIRDTQEGLR